MLNDVNLEAGLENVTYGNKNAIMKKEQNGRPPLAVSVSSECTDDNVFGENAGDAPLSPKTGSEAETKQNSNITKLTQLLAPPPPTSRLQVPSHGSVSTFTRPPSALSLGKQSSLISSIPSTNQQRNQSPATPSKPPAPSESNLPLGLKEVMDNYRKEYLNEVYKIVKINIGVLTLGVVLAFGGIGMMTYSAIKILHDIKHEEETHHVPTDEVNHHVELLEAILERAGAVLTGIGAFINMVSIVYILDRRAVLDRERLEKIDTYKKNRQQPRNIFEILLANAKQRAAATLSAKPAEETTEEVNVGATVGVVVTTEDGPPPSRVAAVANGSVKTGSIAGVADAGSTAKADLRRPSISSAKTGLNSIRQRLGSNAISMAKQMADVTTQQLKQYSKAKGDDVEVFVVSHHNVPQRRETPSRPPSASSSKQQLVAVEQAPESLLQIHRSLEDWLKNSVQKTITHEFATEADAESDTMSINLSSEKDDGEGGDQRGGAQTPSSQSLSAPTPEPTQQDFSAIGGLLVPEQAAEKKKKKLRTIRTLPGLNIPIKNVFQELYASQKSNLTTLYDSSLSDRETPLPPPIRGSAHYARRRDQMNRTEEIRKSNAGSPVQWATTASHHKVTGKGKPLDPAFMRLESAVASEDMLTQSRPSVPQSPTKGRPPPPLVRKSSVTTLPNVNRIGAITNSSDDGVTRPTTAVRTVNTVTFKTK